MNTLYLSINTKYFYKALLYSIAAHVTIITKIIDLVLVNNQRPMIRLISILIITDLLLKITFLSESSKNSCSFGKDIIFFKNICFIRIFTKDPNLLEIFK